MRIMPTLAGLAIFPRRTIPQAPIGNNVVPGQDERYKVHVMADGSGLDCKPVS